MKQPHSHSRPMIGLLLDNLFNNYENNIWKHIANAAVEKDCDLLCFLGGSFESPRAFHSQRNVVYSLASKENIDGIIAITSSISNHIGPPGLAPFLSRYKGLPIVSIGVVFEEFPSVIVDNTRSLKDLISHLITVHGRSKIAFIRGPEHSRDAEDRFVTYRKSIEEHGFCFDESLVVVGEFDKGSGPTAVSRLIDERKTGCDAIVASNDYMAIGVLDELARRKIRVPEDIAVTGFDDITEASAVIPSLSTVRQPYFELGRQAVEMITNMLSGHAVPDRVVFPAQCIIRQSCGCELSNDVNAMIPSRSAPAETIRLNTLHAQDDVVEKVASEMEAQLVGFKDNLKIRSVAKRLYDAFKVGISSNDPNGFILALSSLIAEFWDSADTIHPWLHIIGSMYAAVLPSITHADEQVRAEALREHAFVYACLAVETRERYLHSISDERLRVLLQSNNILIGSFDDSVLRSTLDTELPTLGIPGCTVSLYENAGVPTDTMTVHYSSSHNIPFDVDAKRLSFPAREIVPGGVRMSEHRFTGLVLPLYFENEHLGIIYFEAGPQDGTVYETLANKISNSIKGASLVREVREYANGLEQKVDERTADLNRTLDKLRSEIEIRHRIEEELEHEKELAMVTLASIGDGVITTDINGTITYLNLVAENLIGYRSDEVRGEKLQKILNVRYNINRDILGETVDIALGKDRGMKLSGAVILKSRDGREYTIKESISPIRDTSGNHVGVVIVLHNVSETEKMTKLINFQTTHDILTGIYNRVKFNEMLLQMMEEARHEQKEHIFCYIDIDGFKLFNNTLDSVAGDELLRHVASILKQGIRQSDVLGRIGGDQFGLLLSSCPLGRAKDLANDLKQKINEKVFIWEGKEYRVSVSIGVVLINAFSDDIAGVMSAAHAACNFAKKRGGNRIHIWSPENEDIMRFHSDLFVLPQITRALEEDRFCLYKQKIHAIGKTPATSEHHEILVRMIGEDGLIINPARFIPAAERFNIMPQIDRWVVTKLFSSYQVDYYDTPAQVYARYSVNLSASTLDDDDFLTFLQDQFEKYKVPPFMICFEITETTAISNFSRVNEFIKELKKIGCTFALDDFGSGWASFSYLKYLHIDFLKIDGSFVRDITKDPIDFVLVETINHIGHVMGLQTIAEFVEDDQTLFKLKEIGVNFVQGYGLSKPEPF